MDIRIRRLCALLAASLLAVGAAGCAEVERRAEPLVIHVVTQPTGAPVAVTADGEVAQGLPRGLGTSPVRLEGLLVVEKRYVNGTSDYWLLDRQGSLPRNPGKPAYAALEYSAGNDYPLVLKFAAARNGYEPATTALRIDRDLLQNLMKKAGSGPLQVTVEIDLNGRAPARAPAAPSPAP
jgi:hypothetical protein